MTWPQAFAVVGVTLGGFAFLGWVMWLAFKEPPPTYLSPSWWSDPFPSWSWSTDPSCLCGGNSTTGCPVHRPTEGTEVRNT